MNEIFESHIKELLKLTKKLYRYGLYLTIFFILLFVIFLLFEVQKNYFGLIIFNVLMILLFLSEFLYGYYLHKRFYWILNNYQTEQDTCLELLRVRKINIDNLQVDLDKEDLSFTAKYYMHSKKAYEILTEASNN
ncbi:hypothetical protein KHQ81_09150 [Mycoplasmatota bacterium]|nr:hypothetical protein KHQ81_09150 [Mycoplasmatota bacterium]